MLELSDMSTHERSRFPNRMVAVGLVVALAGGYYAGHRDGKDEGRSLADSEANEYIHTLENGYRRHIESDGPHIEAAQSMSTLTQLSPSVVHKSIAWHKQPGFLGLRGYAQHDVKDTLQSVSGYLTSEKLREPKDVRENFPKTDEYSLSKIFLSPGTVTALRKEGVTFKAIANDCKHPKKTNEVKHIARDKVVVPLGTKACRGPRSSYIGW